MTVQEAQRKLVGLRARQRKLRKEIDTLRDFVRSQGVDPDDTRPDMSERDNDIYNLHKTGMKYIDIAKQFGLSGERVSMICAQIEFKKAKKLRGRKG